MTAIDTSSAVFNDTIMASGTARRTGSLDLSARNDFQNLRGRLTYTSMPAPVTPSRAKEVIVKKIIIIRKLLR